MNNTGGNQLDGVPAGLCGNQTLLQVIHIVITVIKILQIAVPVALILWGTLDIGKAVIAGDEKKMKEAQKPFIKRIIYAVIAFLVPFIVSIVMGYVGNTEWKTCWTAAKNAEVSNGTITSDPLYQ